MGVTRVRIGPSQPLLAAPALPGGGVWSLACLLVLSRVGGVHSQRVSGPHVGPEAVEPPRLILRALAVVRLTRCKAVHQRLPNVGVLSPGGEIGRAHV